MYSTFYLFNYYLTSNSIDQLRSLLLPPTSYKPTSLQLANLLSKYSSEFRNFFNDDVIYHALASGGINLAEVKRLLCFLQDSTRIPTITWVIKYITCFGETRPSCLKYLIYVGFPFDRDEVLEYLERMRSRGTLYHVVKSRWSPRRHKYSPTFVWRIARTMFTLRCVPDCIVGGLPPEILEVILRFL